MGSASYERWEASQRLRDRVDIAIIGSTLPREPIPIEHLFAELSRSLQQTYQPFGCVPPILDQGGEGVSDGK